MKTSLSLKSFISNNTFLLLVNFFLLLCFFSQLQTINIGHFFNSDSLYLPSLYRDLFVDKNSLKGWHLNPAPDFFPNMFFYCILMFLCGNNFIVTSFVFAFIQYFIFLYILVRLFKIIVPGQSAKLYPVIYSIPTLCLLAVFYLHGIYIFAYLLLSCSYHAGSFIMALLSLLILLQFFEGGYSTRAVLLFIVAFLAVFSDKLYIVSFVAPVSFASLFFLKKHTKIALTIICVTSIATLLALWLFDVIDHSNYLWFAKVSVTEINGENILRSFNRMCFLVKEFFLFFSYHTLSIYLFFLSIACLIYLLITQWKTAGPVLRFALLFIISQSLLVIFAPILAGNFTGQDTFRYNLYPIYLAGLNLAIFLALCIRRNTFTKLTYKYAMFVFILSAFIGGLYKFEPKGITYFFTYYPETARKLDNIAEKEGLLRGVGNYWYAKVVTLFSKKGVKVHAVFDDLSAYRHVTNENWFFDPNHKFNFVLLNNFADTSLYKKNVLYSKRLYDEADLILVKTNIFGYKEPGDLPKN